MNETNPTQPAAKPFDLKARLGRIGLIAFACLVVLSGISWFFWSWQGAVSCFMGGLGILLAGWVTIAAVGGVATDSNDVRRAIAYRLVVRFLIFIAYFIALFNVPILIFEPLMIGMSLLFPALVLDSIVEMGSGGTK